MYLFKRKKKIYLLFPIILLIFFYFLSFRFYEIKKDFGQEIRIFLKTPTLYHARSINYFKF